MLSATCLNLDQCKVLSSVNGLNLTSFVPPKRLTGRKGALFCTEIFNSKYSCACHFLLVVEYTVSLVWPLDVLFLSNGPISVKLHRNTHQESDMCILYLDHGWKYFQELGPRPGGSVVNVSD